MRTLMPQDSGLYLPLERHQAGAAASAGPSRETSPGENSQGSQDSAELTLLSPRTPRSSAGLSLPVDLKLPIGSLSCTRRTFLAASLLLLVFALASWGASHTRSRGLPLYQRSRHVEPMALAQSEEEVTVDEDEDDGVIRVACVGASITEGKRGFTHSRAPYPKQLQEILGPGYKVVNFGVGDKTVLRQTNRAYWKQPLFRKAKEFRPKIVVFQFGADDTKFPELFKMHYRHDFGRMIHEFQELPSHPDVFIMAPPPVYNGMADRWGIDRDLVNGGLQTRMEEICKMYHLHPPISVWSAFFSQCDSLENNTCPLMSADGVHPNSRGFSVMAHLVHTVIKTLEFQCSVDQQARIPCGTKSISELDCKRLKCCYDGSCFKPRSLQPAPQHCPVRNQDKTNCGWFGIKGDQCASLGCCFSPSHMKWVPWCYHSFLSTTTTTTRTITKTATTSTSTTVTMTNTTTTVTFTSTTQTSTTTSTSTTTLTSTHTSTTTSTTTLTSTTTTTLDFVGKAVYSVKKATTIVGTAFHVR